MKKDKENDKENKHSTFWKWYYEKEHPNSKLNVNVFVKDSILFVSLLIAFFIIYLSAPQLNQLKIFFIKIGSVIQIAVFIWMIIKVQHLIFNLRYWFRGFNHGTKTIWGLGLILILFIGFLFHNALSNFVVNTFNNINFPSFFPFDFGLKK